MKARSSKRFAALLLSVLPLTATALTTAEADSLMHEARTWRSMGNLDHALYLFTTVGTDEATFEAATTQYLLGQSSSAIATCRRLVDSQSEYALDARVLIGQCRQQQGFDFAAKRIYQKAIDDGSSAAAAKYGQMMYAKGHLNDAQSLAQQAITLNPSNAEAHLLLAGVMANQGKRFEAMMPLYYFLLIADNDDDRNLAYTQLMSLWRRSSKSLNFLKAPEKPDPHDFCARINAQIDTWTTSDSIAHAEGSKAIRMLHEQTDRLFRFLLDESEQNLDFWQITYSDFFVRLVPRNFVEPYVYFISSTRFNADVLTYVAENPVLFNEFRLWMEAQ